MEGQIEMFSKEDFGYNRHGTLSVNNCFEGISFINYEGFLEKNGYITEGAYLLLRKCYLKSSQKIKNIHHH